MEVCRDSEQLMQVRSHFLEQLNLCAAAPQCSKVLAVTAALRIIQDSMGFVRDSRIVHWQLKLTPEQKRCRRRVQ